MWMCGDGKWNHIIFNSVTRAGMLPSTFPGSTPHPGVFSWAFLWLCAHLLMELNWCDLMDTALSQTNSTPVAASLHLNRREELKNTQTFSRQNRIRQSLWFGDKNSGWNFEWQTCLHCAVLHYRQLHNNKRSPLSQKSLKVTEWILIRSGVVNSSQHGVQWD